MNGVHSVLIVIVTVVCTLITRATPFLLFGNKKRKVPQAVLYIGEVLPAAVMATLLIYSVKHVSFTTHYSDWVYEIVGVLVTALIHIKWRNTLLSIGVGTVMYMVLTQGLLFS